MHILDCGMGQPLVCTLTIQMHINDLKELTRAKSSTAQFASSLNYYFLVITTSSKQNDKYFLLLTFERIVTQSSNHLKLQTTVVLKH